MLIKSGCFRYVIPFKYEEDYAKACAAVDGCESPRWVRESAQSFDRKSDLYEYIRDEFFDDDAAYSNLKQGCRWGVNVPPEEQGLVYCIPDSEDTLRFDISDMGLFLFRNKIGFLWYEIEIDAPVEEHVLLAFQNRFKEMSDYNNPFFRVEGNGGSQFFLADCIRDALDVLSPIYFSDRQSRNMTIPDKALLFSCCIFESSQETVETKETHDRFVIRLANGYKENFHLSRQLLSTVKKPFSDISWYASQEGAAIVVWPQSGVDSFFVSEKGFKSKIRSDYFSLYIKSLYMSYSLLGYAERVQRTISVKDAIEKPDEDVTNLYNEINLFLAKSMATSVSHIHHQSEFFVYLKGQLRVHADIKSLTAGLNSLDAIQREQRQLQEWEKEKERDRTEREHERRMQRVMGLFSVLAISSALVDCFDFIYKFSAEGDAIKLASQPGLLVVEVVFLAFFIGVGLYTGYYAFKNMFSKS